MTETPKAPSLDRWALHAADLAFIDTADEANYRRVEAAIRAYLWALNLPDPRAFSSQDVRDALEVTE